MSISKIIIDKGTTKTIKSIKAGKSFLFRIPRCGAKIQVQPITNGSTKLYSSLAEDTPSTFKEMFELGEGVLYTCQALQGSRWVGFNVESGEYSLTITTDNGE